MLNQFATLAPGNHGCYHVVAVEKMTVREDKERRRERGKKKWRTEKDQKRRKKKWTEEDEERRKNWRRGRKKGREENEKNKIKLKKSILKFFYLWSIRIIDKS